VERCHRIEAREATTEELGLIHSKEHILKMRNSARLGSSDLCSLQERYNSIFLNSSSYSSALLAAGSVLNVRKCLLKAQYSNSNSIAFFIITSEDRGQRHEWNVSGGGGHCETTRTSRGGGKRLWILSVQQCLSRCKICNPESWPQAVRTTENNFEK